MGIFKLAGKIAVGAARIYNTLADHLPVPLPRMPDGRAYDTPEEYYQPPQAPARPASTAPEPKASGISVETVGSKAEYEKAKAAKSTSADTAAKKTGTAMAPEKTEAQPSPKKAAPRKAAPKKAAPKKAAPKKAAPKKAASTAELESLTKAELKKQLDAKGIKYTTKDTKVSLIQKLTA